MIAKNCDVRANQLDALTLLHTRNSSPRLSEPAPDSDALDLMLKAAFRAPDHARLRPWRFLKVAGDGRIKLGEIFANSVQKAALHSGESAPTERELAKLKSQPLRAPLILIAIATIKEHPKVPRTEQLISAGCAAHSILLAAHALGYAGVWRTGLNAYSHYVKGDLGLSSNEEIVGFLYLGTIDGDYKILPEMEINEYCRSWTGNAAQITY